MNVHRRRGAFWAIIAVLVLATSLTACTVSTAATGTRDSNAPLAGSSASPTPSDQAPSTTPKPKPKPKPVHVALLEGDGQTFGVGMPIIAWFSAKVTDARQFQGATRVTVNGTEVHGAWYFEPSTRTDYALEGHYRLNSYWPPHASIEMSLPVAGLSAGPGLAFDDSLTLSISTGAKNIGTVNSVTHEMTVTTDGHPYGTFPVSLGATKTPTVRGVKVIMEKGLDISMRGPGYFDPHVKFTQRLTFGGEYLHSAPWNVGNIGHVNTSNGCTNLLPADAERLYDFLRVGDVVNYPDADGPEMSLGAGYGDWNVDWGVWLSGGAAPTH